MEKWNFNNVYALFDPQNTKLAAGSVSKPHPINEVMQTIMNNTVYSQFDSLKKSLSHLEGISRTDPDLKFFHGIGDSGHLFSNDPYFVNKADKQNYVIKNSRELCYGLQQGEIKNDKKLAVFVSHNPFITPARRSTPDIERFLNFTPSIFASQMVPYLDVEMQLARAPIKNPDNGAKVYATHLTTPTLMRFVLGAEALDNLKGADKLIEEGRIARSNVTNPASVTDDKTTPTATSYSGMEMFLAPQVFTNMDGLTGNNPKRLVDVKPFLPLASIEAFDITIVNAGAGAMAHRKATLRLKIHDKARLGEFAIFIRGNLSFGAARFVTTYGWIAPRGRGTDDEYADFVNRKMVKKDTWMLTNSSYSFDLSGQVTLNLELVSAGAQRLQTALIMDKGMQAYMRELDAMAQVLTRLSEKFKEFNVPDLKIMQVIETGASGKFPDMSKSKKDLTDVLDALQKNTRITPAERQEYVNAIKTLGDTDSKSLRSRIDAAGDASAEEMMQKILSTPDPFFPGILDYSDGNVFKNESYNPDYLELIGKLNHYTTDGEIAAKIAAAVAVKQAQEKQRLEKDEAARRDELANRIFLSRTKNLQDNLNAARATDMETSIVVNDARNNANDYQTTAGPEHALVGTTTSRPLERKL